MVVQSLLRREGQLRFLVSSTRATPRGGSFEPMNLTKIIASLYIKGYYFLILDGKAEVLSAEEVGQLMGGN